jgi:hypothetical protein
MVVQELSCTTFFIFSAGYKLRATAFSAANLDFDNQQGSSHPKFLRALSCLLLIHLFAVVYKLRNTAFAATEFNLDNQEGSSRLNS